MQTKPNVQGLVGLVSVFAIILSAFLTSPLLSWEVTLTYTIFATIPYTLGVIFLTHWREGVQRRLAAGVYPVTIYARPRSITITREKDERRSFNLWRFLIGFHFAFALLTIGLWLPVIFGIRGEQIIGGTLAGYFIIASAAGILAPYLIWLRR